jgi:hypothetical protein
MIEKRPPLARQVFPSRFSVGKVALEKALHLHGAATI